MTFAGGALRWNMRSKHPPKPPAWLAKQRALLLALGLGVGTSPEYLPAYLWIPLVAVFAFWLGLMLDAFRPHRCLFCDAAPAMPVFTATGEIVPSLPRNWWDLRPPPRKGTIWVCFVHLISYADGRPRR